MAMSEFEMDIFDPFDMDREEFNPAMCMVRYSQDCTFSNIMLKKSHIDREIRVINSDLQNLLYDNYQKIDKVTTVITNMKTDFLKMEQKMDDLYDQMNGIARTSSRILEDLQPEENKMSKLLKAQNTIKKLSSLTELVPTLKMFIDSGIYNVAARCYLKAEKILKKFSYFPSLNGIVNDCSELLVEIRSGLRNKLNCEMYEKEELIETLHLLLALQEIPGTLLKHFLICGEKYLADLLISMDKIWSADFSEGDSDNFPITMNTYINSSCKYIENMTKVLETAKRVFLSQTDFKSNLLDISLEEFFTQNMNCLRIKLLNHMENIFKRIDDDLLSQVLDKFIRKCHESGIIKNKINFYNEGLDIIFKICNSRCEIILQTMKEDFNMQLVKIAEELSPLTNISNLVLCLMEWTEQKLMSVLLSVVLYIRPEFRCHREVAFRKVFCKIIVREGTFVEFLKHIIKQSWLFLTTKNLRCFSKPLLCIVLTGFLLDLSDVVPNFLFKVDKYLSSTSENFSLTSAETITAEYKATAVNIVDLYIHIRYQSLTHMIEKSTEHRNWMASKEPTRPRAVIKMMLNDLFEAKQETEKIFGTCLNPLRKKVSNIGNAILCDMYTIGEKSKQNFINEKVLLNKLFLECPISSTKVELTTSSIVNSLLKNTLNSFVQFIRLKTLNDFSLQQIQVDVCYMLWYLKEWIQLDPTVEALFDEIIASAYNRTINPQMMNSHIVSAICNDIQ